MSGRLVSNIEATRVENGELVVESNFALAELAIQAKRRDALVGGAHNAPAAACRRRAQDVPEERGARERGRAAVEPAQKLRGHEFYRVALARVSRRAA